MNTQKDNPSNFEKKSETNNGLSEFISYLLEMDEVSFVLKSHLHLERALDELISKVAVNSGFVKDYSFKNKTEFLYTTGVISKIFYDKIIKINSIRNKFSHQYKYKLSKVDLDDLLLIIREDVEIPKKLCSFPRAKESILFASAVALLEDVIRTLIRLDKIDYQNIYMNAHDHLSSNNK